MIQLTLLQQIKLNKTNKDFFLFDVDDQNKVINYIFTNDLFRYKNKFTKFRVISTIKKTEYTTLKQYKDEQNI